MLIDRRDVNALKKIAELDVPSFDAFRGTIVGTNLYLVSTSQAQTAVVDLSTPTAPKVSGTVAMPAVSGGIAIVGRDGFTASGTAGPGTLRLTNPVSPT